MNASRQLVLATLAGLAWFSASPPSWAQAAAPDGATSMVVVVRVAKPWYAPRSVVVGKMRESVPLYERQTGLLFKAFSLERETGDFGGLYLWKDEASARTWFDAAWHERVVKTYGADAKTEWFDTPILLPSSDPANLAAAARLQAATP